MKLEAISGSTSVTLMDTTVSTNTYGIVSAKGLGGVAIRRVTARGPAQNGESDGGYRMNARDIELTVGFKAATDALLDASRDQLHSVFKPLSATPVNIKLTRDDGGIKQLNCYLVGDVDIKLDPSVRPGHYHRATIKLYAPDPRYYNPTPGTVTVTGTAGTAADWYLAGGAIGTASVLMSGGTPTQGQVWSYAGTIAHGTSWTLAFRTTQEGTAAATKYAYVVNNTGVLETPSALGIQSNGSYIASTDGNSGVLGTAFMPSGTSNIFVRHDTNGLDIGDGFTGGQDLFNSTDPGYAPSTTHPISGTARRWRSDATNSAGSRWSGAILLYALYSPGLSYSQIQALDTYMAGGIGGTLGTYLSVPYLGDLLEYPVLSLTGPITGARIQNIVTGENIYFGTNVVGAGTTYVIDTRPGLQSIKIGTVNHPEILDPSSQLLGFSLSPDSGNNGINPILVTGTNTNASTQLSVVWYNRYSSM